MGPVLQNLEGLFEDLRRVGGDREHVDSFVEARVGVDVRAQLHANRQVIHQLLLGEVLCAVERHVLHEVGQSQLIVIFQHGAGFHDEPQLRSGLRPVIDSNEVAEAIVQRPDRDLGIDREHLASIARLLGMQRARGKEDCDDGEG